MQNLIEKLPPDQVEKYTNYSAENQNILSQIAKSQAEIKETKDSVEKLKEAIAFDNVISIAQNKLNGMYWIAV